MLKTMWKCHVEGHHDSSVQKQAHITEQKHVKTQQTFSKKTILFVFSTLIYYFCLKILNKIYILPFPKCHFKQFTPRRFAYERFTRTKIMILRQRI